MSAKRFEISFYSSTSYKNCTQNKNLTEASKMGASNRKGQLDNEKLEALKEQTNMNHGAIIELYNEFQKDCPSGKLNQQQLCKIYRLMFPNGNPTTFCKHLFRTFDLDKNGHIDFVEFLLAINITSDATSENKIHWAFKIYDIDGNGYITQQEFNSVVKSIYKIFGNNLTKKTENDLKEKLLLKTTIKSANLGI